jgi:putative addiction module component (TIGR02574 family)
MTPSVEQLKATLAELPRTDKAELAHFLLTSMEPTDADAEEAWHEELERRLEDIRSGREVGIPAEEVMDRLRKKYP